jgi:hypothetical protein
MSVDMVDRFLKAMLPEFPKGYSPEEREYLMRDTSIDEIWMFRPDIIRRVR